jgi:hypothetical protein
MKCADNQIRFAGYGAVCSAPSITPKRVSRIMKNNLLSAVLSMTTFASLAAIGLTGSVAHASDDPHRGVSQLNDGSFNYQGYLEEDGAPANGVYFFEVHILDSNGDEIDSRFDQPGPITVTDGLFDMDIQMGGTPADAEFFWRNFGHLAKKLQIMVGTVEGGPYTTLSPDVDLGSSPHALWSRYAGALQFPYTETYGNNFADQDTMLSLTHQFGGTVLELIAGLEQNPAILSVLSPTPSGTGFGSQTGAIHVDVLGRRSGLVSIADEFPVVGLLSSDSGIQNTAVLGQVGTGVPGAHAIQALNLNSDNYAYLGTPDYAGEFTGKVLVSDNLRVQGEPTRDYALNSPSPIGPLAYASVNSNAAVTSGTANISVTWDSVQLRYVVAVAGENMHFTTHTVSVSVVDTVEPRLATFNAFNGDIVVKIWDLNSGNAPVPDNFSIVIYDANPVVLSRATLPNDVDQDKYIEKTGATLIETQPRNEPVEAHEAKGIGQQD